MSLDALKWVLYEAPPRLNGVTLNGTKREVLLCLAEHADKDGRNSFPGRSRIAEELWGTAEDQADPLEPGAVPPSAENWARACGRKVTRAFSDLKKGGWIVEDPGCAHPDYRGMRRDQRTVAWALNMDLKRASRHERLPVDAGDAPSTLAVERLDTDGPTGRRSCVERLDAGDDQTVINHQEPEGKAGAEAAAPSSRAQSETTTMAPPKTGAQWVDGEPRCDAHATLPPWDRPKCWACADARRYLETRETLQRERAQTEKAARISDRAATIAACSLCDEGGWIDSRDAEGRLSVVRCSHVSDAAVDSIGTPGPNKSAVHALVTAPVWDGDSAPF